jgi:hypothetical protein
MLGERHDDMKALAATGFGKRNKPEFVEDDFDHQRRLNHRIPRQGWVRVQIEDEAWVNSHAAPVVTLVAPYSQNRWLARQFIAPFFPAGRENAF